MLYLKLRFFQKLKASNCLESAYDVALCFFTGAKGLRMLQHDNVTEHKMRFLLCLWNRIFSMVVWVAWPGLYAIVHIYLTI